MNTKMKKVVAGAVLGTFAFGVASPAFAAEGETEVETLPVEQTVVEETAEETYTEAETRGAAKHVIQAVKKVIVDYWDKLPLPDKADFIRENLLEALDYYFQFTDDVETAVRNAIYDVFPNANATIVNGAVVIIMELLPF